MLYLCFIYALSIPYPYTIETYPPTSFNTNKNNNSSTPPIEAKPAKSAPVHHFKAFHPKQHDYFSYLLTY